MPAVNPAGSPERQVGIVEVLDGTACSNAVGPERRLLVSEAVGVDACAD